MRRSSIPIGALCIDANDVPGSHEVTEGPTTTIDASGTEVKRRVQEDRFGVYPTGMDGRIVLVIPPGKRWFYRYSLTEILDLGENRKYSAIVATHGLFCELYEKGTPEEIMDGWDEYEKYRVLIVSDRVEFHTGRGGAD